MSTNHGGREPTSGGEQAATSNGGEPVVPPRRPSSRRFISQIPSIPGSSQPGVREIHKNAWLKRLTSPDRRSTPFIRKYERQWVVFCVHDDVEALLEFYSDPKMGATHKPLSTISLKTCLHVTPSIVGQEKEFEFAVTLPTQVIRLVANTWDQMTEWVDSLQGKLREMGILSPKDNVYSKLPETQVSSLCSSRYNTGGQVTTRDPNSPLPPPPGRLPNELFRISELPVSLASGSSTFRESAAEERCTQRISPEESATGEVIIRHCTQESSDPLPLQNSRVGRSVVPRPSGSMTSSLNAEFQDEPFVGSSISQPKPLSKATVMKGGAVQVTVTSNPVNIPRETCSNAATSISCANTSVVEVICDDRTPMPMCTAARDTQSSDVSRFCSLSIETGRSRTRSDCLPLAMETAAQNLNHHVAFLGEATNEKNHNHSKLNSLTKLNDNGRCFSSENLYEYLFIPDVPVTNLSSTTAAGISRRVSNPGESSHQQITDNDFPPPVLHPKRNRHSARPERSTSSISSATRSSSLSRIKDCREDDHTEPRTSSSASSFRSSSHFVDIIRPRDSYLVSRINEDRGRQQLNMPESNRPLEAMIGIRSGEYRIRRDDSSFSGTGASAVEGAGSNGQCVNSVHVPLKEQQVIRLKSEISHHAGVRIVLRKKDCINSIALVDYLGAVWVAGWKQPQFPVLYYAFHVGDQILKIAGVTVQSSSEAQRAIKLNSSMQVEFVIRRLPYGRVLVIKRSKEGEALGIVSAGNSGEIREVQTNSLAANHGLPTNALGTDGNSSPCNWFLTEINNRPLSLFAKEIEVRDRLNAVGKEISILVQPADLVKHLRKQLKATKNFKDYLVG